MSGTSGLSTDLPLSLPEDLLVLKKYLGPSIDVGSTMTVKIFTPTREVVHHSTYRPLTPEELEDPVKQDHEPCYGQQRTGRDLA